MPLTRTVFANANLQDAIDKAAKNIPEGHSSAVVAHVDLDGASLTVIGKLDDHWTIQAAAVKPWTGPLSAEAEVVASW